MKRLVAGAVVIVALVVIVWALDRESDPELLFDGPARVVDTLATSGDSMLCADALAEVHDAGLDLPEGWAYECPGNTRSYEGDRQHAGVACPRDHPLCPTGPVIRVNPASTEGSGLGLACVVAHETGHAVEYETRGTTTEAGATRIAADTGFAPACQGQP